MSESRHWSSDEKTKFRSKPPWKTFRAQEIKKRKGKDKRARCDLCGSMQKDSAFDLHHLEPDQYDNLDPAKFKLLDTKCHEFVEWMAIRLAVDKGNNLYRSDLMLAWVGNFLPKIERTVDKFMRMPDNKDSPVVGHVTNRQKASEGANGHKESNMKVGNDGSGNWEAPPIKSFNGRVIGIYDIGTQDGYQGKEPNRQMVFEYEIVSATKDSEGKNFKIAEFMTASNHSKAGLMARVQAISGQTFKGGTANANGFFYELPEDFTTILRTKVLNAPVLLNLVPKPNDPTKPKVGSVGQPMEGFTVGPAENGIGWLDSEDDPGKYQADLAAAPEWIKKKVNASHENRGIKPVGHNGGAGAMPTKATPAIDPETGAPLDPGPRPHEDDPIPF